MRPLVECLCACHGVGRGLIGVAVGSAAVKYRHLPDCSFAYRSSAPERPVPHIRLPLHPNLYLNRIMLKLKEQIQLSSVKVWIYSPSQHTKNC